MPDGLDAYEARTRVGTGGGSDKVDKAGVRITEFTSET